MRIINNISEKQNEEGMLQLQFCARHLYDTATILNIVSWICCLIITVILPFIDSLGGYKYLVAAGINTIILIIDLLANRYIKLGAAYKMRFDYVLFHFSNCKNYHGHTIDLLKEKAAGIIKRHTKSYNRQITHNGTTKPNGVKDWYVDIPKKISNEEAVKRCQEQNGFFDKTIMKYSWWVFVTSIVIGLSIFIAVNHDKDLLTSSLIFISGFALIKKIITEIYSFVKVYYTNVFADWVKTEPDISPMLKQKIIDERRTRNVFATSLIYKMISNSLHSTIKAKENVLSEEE